VRLQLPQNNILAAADNGVRGGKRPHFRPKGKCALQSAGESLGTITGRKECSGTCRLVGGREADNLAFNQSSIDAADASRFARTGVTRLPLCCGMVL